MSLFDTTPPSEPARMDPKRPLAERMRPTRLEDFIGQEHILGPDKPLRRQIEQDRLTSIILWGLSLPLAALTLPFASFQAEKATPHAPVLVPHAAFVLAFVP